MSDDAPPDLREVSDGALVQAFQATDRAIRSTSHARRMLDPPDAGLDEYERSVDWHLSYGEGELSDAYMQLIRELRRRGLLED